MASQLQAAHYVHGMGQSIRRTVMEVGVGQFDIAQRGHFELEAVSIFTGDAGQAFSLVACCVGLYNAHFLKRCATDCGAVVAGNTAAVLEQLIPCQFLLCNGVFLTQQPAVKAGVGCDQGF